MIGTIVSEPWSSYIDNVFSLYQLSLNFQDSLLDTRILCVIAIFNFSQQQWLSGKRMPMEILRSRI